MTLEEAAARLNAMAERRARRAMDYRDNAALLENLENLTTASRVIAHDTREKYLRDADFADADAKAITLILFTLSANLGESDGSRRRDSTQEAEHAGAAAG